MKVFIAHNPTEAHIVCGLLQQAQIACEVRGEMLFAARGELPCDDSSSPYVWLLNPNAEKKAKGMINEYLQPKQEKRPEWRCKQCGEDNEPQFGLCWNCGSEEDSRR